MNPVSRYILSVTAAAILAAILKSLAGKNGKGRLVHLVAGIFMAVTMISPLMEVRLPDMQQWYFDFSADGIAAAAAGENMAAESAGAIIKEKLEAYILDKAAMYQASVTADVTLDETGRPVYVIMTGDLSPYAKTRLAHIITFDLGVGEEAQEWIS